MNARINGEKPKNTLKTLGRLFKYIGKSKYVLYALICITLLITAAELLSPVMQQKAIDTIRLQVDADEPSVGRKVPFSFEDRDMHLYRMPSSSRAYPLALEKKAEYYLSMFKDLGIY
jgi:ABC-type multidrug transport system fused ATPase/permease subunit